jgi:hypothetical protein
MAGNKKGGRTVVGRRDGSLFVKPKIVHVGDPLFQITFAPHMHLNAFYNGRGTGSNWLAMMVRLKVGAELEKLFKATDQTSLSRALRAAYIIEDRFLKENVWSASREEVADLSLGLCWTDALQSVITHEELIEAFRVAVKWTASRESYL